MRRGCAMCAVYICVGVCLQKLARASIPTLVARRIVFSGARDAGSRVCSGYIYTHTYKLTHTSSPMKFPAFREYSARTFRLLLDDASNGRALSGAHTLCSFLFLFFRKAARIYGMPLGFWERRIFEEFYILEKFEGDFVFLTAG